VTMSAASAKWLPPLLLRPQNARALHRAGSLTLLWHCRGATATQHACSTELHDTAIHLHLRRECRDDGRTTSEILLEPWVVWLIEVTPLSHASRLPDGLPVDSGQADMHACSVMISSAHSQTARGTWFRMTFSCYYQQLYSANAVVQILSTQDNVGG
jgi:hypothetical protein